MTTVESHLFARKPDDSFHVHQMGSREPDAHYIAPLGLRPYIRQPVDEIDAVIFVSWKHAAAFDADRQQDKLGHQYQSNRDTYQTHKRAFWIASNQHNAQPCWFSGFGICQHKHHSLQTY